MRNKFFYLLAAAFAALLLFCLFGCSPAKIGQEAVKKYKASSEFPADCALNFPSIVKEGEIKVDTVHGVEIDCEAELQKYAQFWEGVSTENEKERQALADSIAAMIARGEKPPAKKFRCPPSVYSVRVDTVESTAKLEAANRLNNELRLQYAADTAARNRNQEIAATKTKKVKTIRNYSIGLNLAFILALAGAIYLNSKKKFFTLKKRYE